jgi:hypothetical protein
MTEWQEILMDVHKAIDKELIETIVKNAKSGPQIEEWLVEERKKCKRSKRWFEK